MKSNRKTQVPGPERLLRVKIDEAAVEDELTGSLPVDSNGDYDGRHHNDHSEDRDSADDGYWDEDDADGEGTDGGCDNSIRAAYPCVNEEVADGDGVLDGVDMGTSVVADCHDVSDLNA
mmetsp:Transcript_8909/g.21786  ORF Transcript_8909/g.21786 Transcript_8909/m.21786 type:complete len:119 (-) Transcript_8909:546-902(-)